MPANLAIPWTRLWSLTVMAVPLGQVSRTDCRDGSGGACRSFPGHIAAYRRISRKPGPQNGNEAGMTCGWVWIAGACVAYRSMLFE